MELELQKKHSHCLNCMRSHCNETAECPVEYCRNDCGATMHRCKWPDHDGEICPEAMVKCTNCECGCEELIVRKNLSAHILHCPASAMYCRFVYTRRRAAKLGECALEEPGSHIDEKMLEGDMSLLQDSPQPPCLGLSVENSSYSSMRRRGSAPPTIVPVNRRFCTTSKLDEHEFHCNQILRRDEFQVHWLSYHLEVQLGPFVKRCPLTMYGCTHGQEDLVPSPPGTTLNFNKELDSYLVTSPPHSSADLLSDNGIGAPGLSEYEAKIKVKRELSAYGYGDDEEESYDVLGQLPVELLLAITCYLDSITLWNLSMVNHYFRRVCFGLVKKRGVVYNKWIKDPDTANSSTWIRSAQVWSFSKVSANVASWCYDTDIPPMAAHLSQCDVYKSVFKTYFEEGEKKKLHGMMID